MQSLKLPMDAGTKSLEGLNSDYITSDSLTENQHSSSQHEYCHGRVNGQKDIYRFLPNCMYIILFEKPRMTIETLNTVDDRSSLFVGDQCLWVTLAHKFTSPDELVYIQTFV